VDLHVAKSSICDMHMAIMGNIAERDLMLSIGMAPCMVPEIDNDMLNKFLMVPEEYRDYYIKWVNELWINNDIVVKKIYSIFSAEGLRFIMDSGYLPELPSGIQAEFDYLTRLRLLKRCICTKHNMTYLIVSEEYLENYKGLTIYIDKEVRMELIQDESMNVMHFRKMDIGEVFIEYIDYAIDNNIIYDIEKSKRIMQNILEEYAEKFGIDLADIE